MHYYIKFSKICKVGFSHFTGRESEMLCTITLNFQRYAKLVFHISQVVKVKCYALLQLNIQRYAKLVFHASQVVKVKCYALLRLKNIAKIFKVSFSTPNRP